MAAVAETPIGSDDKFLHPSPADSKSEFQRDVRKLVDLLSKLNPSAKEFFPSSYSSSLRQSPPIDPANKDWSSDGSSNSNRRKKNNYNQGRRRLNGRAYRAQREDSIRRTVYVSDIDQHVTEEQLAALFINCGQVVDCRVCGDPHSVLRFAFIEFADEQGARAALSLGGTMLGYYPVRVLPSKTAILPVNPTFLPRSEDEREMCARTVYCTNIDKKVSQTDVKIFFESFCGEVSRLRLLGIIYIQPALHSLNLFRGMRRWLSWSHDQYVPGRLPCSFYVFPQMGGETPEAESAIIALNCSGMLVGALPIRVSPSKTPVRHRVTRAIVQ